MNFCLDEYLISLGPRRILVLFAKGFLKTPDTLPVSSVTSPVLHLLTRTLKLIGDHS